MPDLPSSARGRILDAAFNAFMRSGYEGASTAEIARLARVSKRDLYANFPNKQAMLAACVADRAEAMRRPLNLPVPDSREALHEALIAYGTAVVLEITRPAVLATYRLAVLNAETAPDVARTLDESGRRDTTNALITLLGQVQQQRGWLPGADAEEMAEVFLGILLNGGLLIRALMRLSVPPTPAEARQRAELAASSLRGLYGGAE
jgi:AcrR family transcriptional regulator